MMPIGRLAILGQITHYLFVLQVKTHSPLYPWPDFAVFIVFIVLKFILRGLEKLEKEQLMARHFAQVSGIGPSQCLATKATTQLPPAQHLARGIALETEL